MLIAIVTAKHRIFSDLIRNYDLDEKECKIVDNFNTWMGLYFDRLIFTCFYKDVRLETRQRILMYVNKGVEIEYLPCTPDVCDVHV